MSSEEPNQKNMEIHTSKNILTNLSYNCLRTDHINTSVWYYAIDDILKKMRSRHKSIFRICTLRPAFSISLHRNWIYSYVLTSNKSKQILQIECRCSFCRRPKFTSKAIQGTKMSLRLKALCPFFSSFFLGPLSQVTKTLFTVSHSFDCVPTEMALSGALFHLVREQLFFWGGGNIGNDK